MTEPPLYERDPEAWRAHLAEGNRTQARKRVGADVLFRHEAGRILPVDPRYKPDWDLPGGKSALLSGVTQVHQAARIMVEVRSPPTRCTS